MMEKNISKRSILSNLPLTFEKNIGQKDAEVKFLVRGNGYTAFFTSKEIILALLKDKKNNIEKDQLKEFGLSEKEYDLNILTMSLDTAQSHINIIGEDEKRGRANYFIGNNPEKWVNDVPIYGQIRYEEVYPGIDVIFYGNSDKLEYDFIVKPGADPSNINLSFKGADNLNIDDEGNLVIKIKDGELGFQKPKVFQEDKKNIKTSYKFIEKFKVGFEVEKYDKTMTLTIDPILGYSTFLGGSNYDEGKGIAVDDLGYIYVVGNTNSIDFPTTSGAYISPFKGDLDIFVVKLDSTKKDLIYSAYIGGSRLDASNGIGIDRDGNAYIAGTTFSPDFPITSGAYISIFTGPLHGFVTKLNADGKNLVYSTFIGGGFTAGNGIAVSKDGYAWIVGNASSNDFPTTAGAYQTTLKGNPDAYVVKLNLGGTAAIYSTLLGGTDTETTANKIAIDSLGNACVVGRTKGIGFPTTLMPYKGGVDAFLTKFNPTGQGIVYSTCLGGSKDEEAFGIALDGSSNAYVTGYTQSNNFPTTGEAYSEVLKGDTDVFVTKVNAAGTNFDYSTLLGQSGNQQGNAIVVDNLGNAYITGNTNSIDFPITSAAYRTVFNGMEDAFVTKLKVDGKALIYSTFLGGISSDIGNGIALDAKGNVYVTGTTSSSNFPIAGQAYASELKGTSDAFITKFNALSINIEKIGFPDPAILGFVLNYKIKIKNNGVGEMTKVLVTDKISDSLEIMSVVSEKGSTSYKGGTVTWDVGTMGVGEVSELEVICMPKVAGEITNKAIVTYDGIEPNEEISSTVTTKVVDICAELDKINKMVDTLTDKVDGTEPSAIKDIKDTAEEIKKKLDGDNESLITQIKDQLDDIEVKINHIISPTANKLTTGPVVRDSAARSLIILVNNSTTSQASVKVTVIDHTQNSSVYSSATLTINGKNAKAKVLPEPPLEYEVIFEGLADGIYCWAAASRDSYNPLLKVNSFIDSNTFRHGDLVAKQDEA